MENDILSAIEIYEKVFQTKNSNYSKLETWKQRNIYKIYQIEKLAFLVVEKKEINFHIWLMGSLKQGLGTKLFKLFTQDIQDYKDCVITVSTFPNTWKIMYSWLLKIGFKEFKREGDKIYLKIVSIDFINYFK